MEDIHCQEREEHRRRTTLHRASWTKPQRRWERHRFLQNHKSDKLGLDKKNWLCPSVSHILCSPTFEGISTNSETGLANGLKWQAQVLYLHPTLAYFLNWYSSSVPKGGLIDSWRASLGLNSYKIDRQSKGRVTRSFKSRFAPSSCRST